MNEYTDTFTGAKSSTVYTYLPPRTLLTHASLGGYTESFTNLSTQAFQSIGRLYNDQIFNQSLSSLVIKIAIYNPNFDMMIVTQVSFDCPNSGVVVPSSSSRAYRRDLYGFREGAVRFRVVVEGVFVVFIAWQTVKRMLSFGNTIRWSIGRQVIQLLNERQMNSSTVESLQMMPVAGSYQCHSQILQNCPRQPRNIPSQAQCYEQFHFGEDPFPMAAAEDQRSFPNQIFSFCCITSVHLLGKTYGLKLEDQTLILVGPMGVLKTTEH